MNAINPQFLQQVERSLGYWESKLAEGTGADLSWFMEEHLNIMQALRASLLHELTVAKGAALLLQAFPLIEHSGQLAQWREIFTLFQGKIVGLTAVKQVEFLNRVGQLNRLLGQVQTAVEQHRQAEQIAESLSDRYWIAAVYLHLSTDFAQLNEFDKAIQFANKALNIFSQLEGSLHWQATLNNTLGVIMMKRGELQTSVDYFSISIAQWQQLANPVELARVYDNLGQVKQWLEQYDEALACYQQALALLAATKYYVSRLSIINNLGSLYSQLGQYAAAKALFLDGISILRSRVSIHPLYPVLLYNLADTCTNLADYLQAERYYDQAITVWRQAGQQRLVAAGLRALLLLKRKTGKWTEAEAVQATLQNHLQRYFEKPWAQEELITLEEILLEEE